MFGQEDFLSSALEVVPGIFAFDFLRYVIGAGGVFLIINGALTPLLRGRVIRDRDIGVRQIRRELLTSFRTVLIFAAAGFLIWLGDGLGLLKYYQDPAALGWGWFVVSVVLMIVLHDAWFYWTHRLIHHPRLFPLFHRTHHRSNNPTPFTAYAFDSGEAAINALYVLVVGAIFPISFLAMFIFTAHMMLRNAIGHCGYEIFPRDQWGLPLFDWSTTVTHHDMHHERANGNYGLYFTFWDRLMGTEHDDYEQRFTRSVRMSEAEQTSRSQTGAALRRAKFILLVALPALTVHLWVDAASAEPARNNDLNGEDINTEVVSTLNLPAPLAAIAGDWATQGYGAVVRMDTCDGRPEQLCGTLIWAWDPAEFRPGAVGSLMIEGARFDGQDRSWQDGRLHNPEDGRTYRGTIVQTTRNTLELKGCAAGIFCQTQIWHRLDSLPHIAGLDRARPQDAGPGGANGIVQGPQRR